MLVLGPDKMFTPSMLQIALSAILHQKQKEQKYGIS